MSQGDGFGHQAGGAIGHDNALNRTQNMIQTKCQRIFFAKIPALRVDHCQSIGVRVLTKADIDIQRLHAVADAGEIGGRGFRCVFKSTIGGVAQAGDVATSACSKWRPSRLPAP